MRKYVGISGFDSTKSNMKELVYELSSIELLLDQLYVSLLFYCLSVALLWTFYYWMRIMAATMQTCNCIHVQVC